MYNRENPIPLSVGDFLQIDLRTTYFSLGDKQSYFKARIHKLVDGAWVEESNLKWTLQTSCPSYQIYNIANTAEGLYRICIVLENVNWYTVTGSLMYPRYENKTITTELYNLYDDSGVIYVKFN